MKMTPKQIQDRLWELDNDRTGLIEAYLRSNGWNYSSSNLLCRWFWEREIDGKIVMVDRATALQFQTSFDQEAIDAETAPEEQY